MSIHKERLDTAPVDDKDTGGAGNGDDVARQQAIK